MKFPSLIFLVLSLNYFLLAQMPGNVIVLDGTQDHARTENQGSVILHNLTSLTISVWVNATEWGFILSNWGGGAVESVSLSTNNFIVNSGNGFGTRQSLSFDDIADSSWHHLAVVWNGNEMIAYLDGEKYAGPDTAINAPWGNMESITIGGRGGEYNVAGLLDEFQIWNKALSQSEIQILMQDTLSSVYYSSADSGLIAYWRFDETENLGVGSILNPDIRDFSVTQSHIEILYDAHLAPSGVVGIDNEQIFLTNNYNLKQNYPNPFNPVTTIKYSIPNRSNVVLKVYDILGKELATLVNEEKDRGVYNIRFYGSEFTSGMYLYRLQAGDFVETKKMVLMK